jgi:hypothetical protein
MRTIKSGEGQTLIDLSMQYLGNADDAMLLSEINGLSITEDLVPGQEIMIPDVAIENKKTVDKYAAKGIVPASSDEGEPEPEGIGFWKIELDFIVS